jgi:hypothetical protein
MAVDQSFETAPRTNESPSDSPSTREQLQNEHNYRNDQDEVDQSARDVETKSKEPENEENDGDGVEHNGRVSISFAVRTTDACKTLRYWSPVVAWVDQLELVLGR